MFWILVIGIIMAVLSSCFWCHEALIYIRAVQNAPEGGNVIQEVKKAAYIISQTPKTAPLGIDILCTIWLTGAFGFSGVLGGIIGLTISNVISVFIIWVSWKPMTKPSKTIKFNKR